MGEQERKTNPPNGANSFERAPEIRTERVRLRQFRPDDLDDLARIFAKPGVMKYLGLGGTPLTREETETILMSVIAHWERRGFGRWAVESGEDGRLIGSAGLRSYGEQAELVYMLDEPFWGRGLATEVARPCLDFGFRVARLDLVVAFIRPDNLASGRVVEKLGMTYEGEFDFFELMSEIGVKNLQREEGETLPISLFSIERAAYFDRNP